MRANEMLLSCITITEFSKYRIRDCIRGMYVESKRKLYELRGCVRMNMMCLRMKTIATNTKNHIEKCKK